MTFEIPEGLAPELYPLAWLVGSWRGRGELNYPGIDAVAADVSVRWWPGDGPFLRYESEVRTPGSVGPGGDEGYAHWSSESGYWRVAPERPDGLKEELAPLEVMLADPAGRVSVYLGAVGGGRVTIASDLIARTSTAAAVAASQRMYGNVEGQLMWVWELAAFGHPLQSYLSVAMDRDAATGER